MSILSVVPLEASTSAGPWPFVIGGLALLILCGALFALVSMGAGREHS
jgi:Flp pilus assembly protein protease CpaA